MKKAAKAILITGLVMAFDLFAPVQDYYPTNQAMAQESTPDIQTISVTVTVYSSDIASARQAAFTEAASEALQRETGALRVAGMTESSYTFEDGRYDGVIKVSLISSARSENTLKPTDESEGATTATAAKTGPWSRYILVLAAEKTDTGALRLSPPDTQWKAAWRVPARLGKTLFVSSVGDALDSRDSPIAQLGAGHNDSFARLGRRYGASGVMLAVLSENDSHIVVWRQGMDATLIPLSNPGTDVKDIAVSARAAAAKALNSADREIAYDSGQSDPETGHTASQDPSTAIEATRYLDSGIRQYKIRISGSADAGKIGTAGLTIAESWSEGSDTILIVNDESDRDYREVRQSLNAAGFNLR